MTISIYDFNTSEVEHLRNLIYNYNKLHGYTNTVLIFMEIQNMIQSNADVYIVPTKLAKHFTEKKVIYINSNPVETIQLLTQKPDNLFINYPIEKNNVFAVLDTMRHSMKQTALMAKVPHGGEERIFIKDLNYIHIVGRNLRYELNEGYIDSHCLRRSFAKETEPYLTHPELYFIAPSLIINLANVKTIYNDCLEFNNKDILYFPKSSSSKIKEAWEEYWK